MPLPVTYASAAQLAAYWRALSADEQTRATGLFVRAATLINELPGAAGFSPAACEHVSLDMVKRALLSPGDGVLETTAAMADMSATQHHLNPVGNLYITPREIRRLRGPRPPTGSLTPTSNVRVPGQPWNYQNSSQTD